MISNLAYHTSAAGRFVAADSDVLPHHRAVIGLFDGVFQYAYIRAAEFRGGGSELDAIAAVIFADLARDVERGIEIVIDDEDVLMDLVTLHYAWLNPTPVRLLQNAYCLTYAVRLENMADMVRGAVELSRSVEGHPPHEHVGDDDCEDQMCAPTDHCVKWGCGKATLEKVGKFWCCPKCGASYGTNPCRKMR